MIDLAISNSMLATEKRLAKIEERIIGIDSNGTGRSPGILQQHGSQLKNLDEGQVYIISQLNKLTKHAETWTKADVWRFVKWSIITIIALLGLVVSYLAYRETLHARGLAIYTPHAQIQTHSNDAGVDPR